MKTRYGFVSNSSSSSFIVRAPEQTTAQTMREMLKLVKAEWREERIGKKHTNAISKCIKWLQSHPKKDIPLLYPNTCNYETWVYKTKDGDLRIDTCNNHDGNWQSMDFQWIDDDNYEKNNTEMRTLEFLDLTDMKTKTYDDFNKILEEKWKIATSKK